MLRALAQLGVIHKPDFASQEDADLFDQLSRNENSVDSLERWGPSLLLALGPAGGRLSPEETHVIRTASRDEGRAVLLNFLESRSS